MSDFATAGGLKTCKVCMIALPLSAFHRRQLSKDGYRNKCKQCRCAWQQAYAKTDAGRSVQVRADQIRNTKFPERRAARSKLYDAVAQGKVTPLPCLICGEEHTEAHHPDYSAPLDVVWLCFRHHKEVHANG